MSTTDHVPNYGNADTYTATASTAVKPGDCLATVSNGRVAPAGAADGAFVGVAAFAAPSGELVTVRTTGVHPLRCTGDIAAGARVTTAPGGAVTVGEPAIGIAQSTSVGGAVRVKLIAPGGSSSGGGGVAPLEIINVKEHGAAGNGVANDKAALLAAITAAKAAGGGVVYLPKGTYLIDDYVLFSDASNVTLQGAGWGTIIKTVGNHPLLAVQNCSGVTIRDLQLLGNSDAAKTAQRGIEGIGLTKSVLHNILVKNMGYDGILLLRGCSQNIVSNCRVEGSQDDGINIGGDNSAPSIGNVVVGCTVSNIGHTGIHISDGSSFTTVSGNTIESCGDAGIDTFQSAAFIGTGKHTIVGNTIRSCALYGIRLRESDYNVASSNSISGCGVSLQTTNSHWSEFIGNICTASTTSGLVLDSASQDIMVASNTFDGATAGVTISSPGTQFRGNQVRGVTASSVVVGATGDDSVVDGNIIAAGTGYGISTSGDRCIISANRITGGFSALRVAASTIECVITSNIVTGGANGIEVSGTDCLVSNNVVNGQTTNGIYVFSATRTSVSDNRSRGSAGRGIFVFGSTDSYVANNSVTSSTGESITENSTSTGTIVVHNRVDGAVQLNGTTPVYRDLSADIVNHGSEYQAAFNFQRSAWRQAKATLAASGASVTATNLIPAGALLIGVTSRINTALTGATGYKVGTAGDDDLWGVVASTLAGSASGSVDFTAAGAAGALYTAAQSVVVTATGSNFAGGEIEVVAHYLHCEAT